MRPADGVEKRCVYWDVSLIEGAENMGVIVRRGEEKDADLSGVRVLGRRQVCLVSGHTEPLDEVPEDLDCMPAGTLAERHVHWVSRNLLLWRLPAAATTSGELCRFQLHSSLSAELSCTVKGLQKADFTLDLLATGTQLPHELIARFPHLSGCTMLRVPDMAQNEAEARGGVSLQRLLQGQLAVSCRTAFGALLDVTGVQLPGVLDEAFWYDGPLGSYEADGGRRALTVWAPTAQNVELLHWRDARGGECHVHQLQPGARGEWTLYHDPGWMWQFYNYRITVYHHQVREVVQVVTTDPYSRCLAGNGERTQILDLHHPHLQPNEWAAHRSPPLASWADISVYEMHIRDFRSAATATQLAFCPEAIKEARGDGELSEGLKHLRELQRCGLNHIHLLPSYDFGSAPERPEEQSPPPQGLARLPPASDEQQRRVLEVADTDAYQWGYDPVHYGTPEGSYATNADGGARVVEFRRMVHGLHQLGLRVVLDVVYNHTFSSGPYDRYSVLDKIVPGYYHRYMENGDTCHSTCCNNTATEHAMCERLVIDDILNWAVNYKVDGFRFDIMGHMMMSTMGKIRAALDRLTLDQDGVDGRGVYLYGEAWDFGEVACNQRGRNASQLNLPGSGLGGFNDRFRDGILGGSPFASPQAQGWVTGLFTRSSSSTASQQPPDSQFDELQAYSQRIKLALAGNLREYELPDGCGGCIKGRHLMIGPVPVAYCQQPWENVLYVGCHDNETLFDAVLMKSAEDLPLQQRADVALLAMAAVAVSQGIAFFHAGDDLLRSKSLDRDSYNSGDWFNRIDWTGQDHTFGSGLPVSTKNYDTWALKGSLLCRSDLKPDPGLIHEVRQRFKALLRIRYSTPLLRLRCADDIMRQLTFPTDDAYQVPGVIVMRIHSSGHPADGTFDPTYDLLLVVLNARAEEVFLPANMTNLQPHPEHASLSEDRLFPHVRVIDNHLRIPPHCIGVFVRARSPSGTTVAPSF